MLERPSQRVSAAVGTWTRKAISQTEFCVGSRKAISISPQLGQTGHRPLVQLRCCSLVILYSAHGLCSLLTPRTIYMHSVSPTTMLISSGRNQLVVWWRTTSFARQGSRNAYVASAILALLSELTTSMTEYHQNDIPLVCIGVDLP